DDNAGWTGQVGSIAPASTVSFKLDGATQANAQTESPFYATSVTSGALSSNNLHVYAYTASYANDPNYNDIANASNSETFIVDKGDRKSVMKGKNADHAAGTDAGHATLRSEMHDNAGVTSNA